MNKNSLQKTYIDLFNKHKPFFPGNNLQWLSDLRQDGINHFEKDGFPDTSVEEWNVYPYTNLINNIYKPGNKNYDNIDLSFIGEKDANCVARLIYLNGRLLKLDADKLPQGLIVNSLKYIIQNNSELIKDKVNTLDNYFENRLSNVVDSRSQSIVSLNSAFHEDGTVILVKKNTDISGYIEIINLSQNQNNLMNHIRSLIHLEEGAKCNVIDRTLNLESKNNLSFASQVIDITLCKKANLSLMRFIEGNIDNTKISSIHSDIEDSAVLNVSSFICSKGDAREEIRVNMNGNNSIADINGLVLGNNLSKNELLTKVRHIGKNTKSDQNIRIILNDKARGSFQGKIRVESNADRTLANMSGKSLLLNNLARVNAKPELEILADDVSCSHGVTVGSLDTEQLFYLCSRGIPEYEAKQLLIRAFSNIVLDNIPLLFLEKAEKFILDYYASH